MSAEMWMQIAVLLATYFIERADAMSKENKARLLGIMKVLEASKVAERNPMIDTPRPSEVIEGIATRLTGDVVIDALLDKDVQEKSTPRVSAGRKVGRFLFNLLPVVSRLVPR